MGSLNPIVGVTITFCILFHPEIVISDYDRASDSSEIVQAMAIAGGKGYLPCNVTLPGTDHPPTLIIWYKNEGGDPVYSYDLRGSRSESSRHWSDDHVLGQRATFRIQTLSGSNFRRRRPDALRIDWKKRIPQSFLVVRSVQSSDQGLYRCRVDFHSAPTRNSRVNLTVIVPPKPPIIVNESGREVTSILGPYTEGSSVQVSCEVSGGRPKPRISWFMDGNLITADSEISSGITVTSTILLRSLDRSSNERVLSCRASNNNISAPVRTSVNIQMNLSPTAVWIQQKEQHLLAGRTIIFRCSSRGSSPQTKFTWFIGEKVLTSTTQMTNFTSELRYVPKVEDHDKTLHCRSENPDLEMSSIEDTLGLIIHYQPIVSLIFGSNLNTTNIRVGDDVYFECRVTSRPAFTKISWFHNGSLMSQNSGLGYIMSNLSLVLQNIRRSASGLYSCLAVNAEGKTMSNKLQLDVKYAPICAHNDNRVYGVAALDVLELTCDVNAHPTDLKFHWRFNSSLASVVDLRTFVQNGTRSVLSYSPSGPEDYGTILCFANNAVGRQREACVYHIIPAGPPDPVTNCSQLNRSVDNVYVNCVPGFDGGLDQLFTMELYAYGTRSLVRNLTLTTPRFSILHLPSATIFEAIIFSSNPKGASELTRLKVSTLKGPSEKRLATIASGSGKSKTADELGTPEKELISRSVPGPLFGGKTLFVILVSITAVLFALVLILGVACKIQCRRESTTSSPDGTFVDNGIEIDDDRRSRSEYARGGSETGGFGKVSGHGGNDELHLLPTFVVGVGNYGDKQQRGEELLPLNPAQLSHSCSFSYPSPGTGKAESIENISCNSNEQSSRFLHTFPRPGLSSTTSVEDEDDRHLSHYPCQSHLYQRDSGPKSTKTVTFLGEVETIHCSSSNSSGSQITVEESDTQRQPRQAQQQRRGNADDDEYCESRV